MALKVSSALERMVAALIDANEGAALLTTTGDGVENVCSALLRIEAAFRVAELTGVDATGLYGGMFVKSLIVCLAI